jgi:translation initiation factor 3 subunit K
MVAFDYAKGRPDHIETILNGLDRYNPETTTVFQDYVTQQCEDRTYDCYANLALLKLYVGSPCFCHEVFFLNQRRFL